MNPRAGGPSPWTDEFLYAAKLDALSNVPIQVWSTKSLTSRWEGPVAVCPEADLIESDQMLSGSIVNTLSFPLRNCMLVYHKSVYELGDIEAGRSVRVTPTSKRSELKTLLTGQRTVRGEGDKWQYETTPYDQASTDLGYILRMMSFHEDVGGERYTRLSNCYQDFVDFSALLKADRAILMTQTPLAADKGHQGAELLRDGKPLAAENEQHGTIYRFVFPVKKGQLP
jgi:hypothetical protein